MIYLMMIRRVAKKRQKNQNKTKTQQVRTQAASVWHISCTSHAIEADTRTTYCIHQCNVVVDIQHAILGRSNRPEEHVEANSNLSALGPEHMEPFRNEGVGKRKVVRQKELSIASTDKN